MGFAEAQATPADRVDHVEVCLHDLSERDSCHELHETQRLITNGRRLLQIRFVLIRSNSCYSWLKSGLIGATYEPG